MSDFYQINDKDINGMLNYLRIFQPEDATREFAVEFLKYLKLSYRKTGQIDPDELQVAHSLPIVTFDRIRSRYYQKKVRIIYLALVIQSQLRLLKNMNPECRICGH